MQYIEKQYLDKISPYLTGFVDRGNDIFNCKCIYCHDSKSNSRKTRGYFHTGTEGNLIYSCRNCSIAVPLTKFIKDNFPQYYTQYCLDTFGKGESKLVIKKRKTEGQVKLLKIRKNIKDTPDSYQSIITLDDNHAAKQYLIDRKIPDLSRFGYTDNFLQYTLDMTNNDERYANLPKDKRIIIPIKNPNGVIIGFQGRAIDSKSMRYITIKIEKYQDEYVKIYGLDKFNKNKFGFIVEGGFDSEFLPNAIAMCGTSLDMNAVKYNYIIPDNMIVIIDNESRNKQIVQRMYQYVDAGFRVYVPPTNINSIDKDINKMILSGWTTRELITLFVNNSYKSMNAKLKIANWKKC